MGNENENKVWLGAVATYTGGASYSVAGHRFVRGKPTKCKTRKARDAVYGKQGFYVLDKWKENMEAQAEPESEPAPAPAKPVVKVAKKLLKKGGDKK